jgi:hypothetical protein
MHENDEGTYPNVVSRVEAGRQTIIAGNWQEQAFAVARRVQRARREKVADGLQIRAKPGEALPEWWDRERRHVGWYHLQADLIYVATFVACAHEAAIFERILDGRDGNAPGKRA